MSENVYVYDRRQYPRFSASAFNGMRVQVAPLPPYFGDTIEGKLLDLSVGGIALWIDELVPKEMQLHLELTFPDHSILTSPARIRRATKLSEGFSIGIEFLGLPDYMQHKIEKMAKDFLSCENRIKARAQSPCRMDCAFFDACDKPQKKDMESAAELLFLMKMRKAA
jgi:c-di-GMP-binding flagellar brake protein YcgR